MATQTEKLMLAGGAVMALAVLLLIARQDGAQIAKQAAANPDAVSACAKIAAQARGAFSQAKELAVMEECLAQRDPAYATARDVEMCQQAKKSGAKPEVFANDFRMRCFGNG